jgi:hypothetical protein
VTSINFSDNSTHITGVGGTHKRGKSSVDFQMINFGWPAGCPENLQILPKGLLKIFPNFIGLMFSKCTISTLNGDELDEYINLQFYAQNYSNLMRVPGNFFKTTLNMKFISFAVNKIQHVGVNFFNNLKSLK